MSERPLSERVRWDNCICGRGMQETIGLWIEGEQCAYCEDADEIAALEAKVERLERACKYAFDELDRVGDSDYTEIIENVEYELSDALLEGREP